MGARRKQRRLAYTCGAVGAVLVVALISGVYSAVAAGKSLGESIESACSTEGVELLDLKLAPDGFAVTPLWARAISSDNTIVEYQFRHVAERWITTVTGDANVVCSTPATTDRQDASCLAAGIEISSELPPLTFLTGSGRTDGISEGQVVSYEIERIAGEYVAVAPDGRIACAL